MNRSKKKSLNYWLKWIASGAVKNKDAVLNFLKTK